MYYFFMAYVLCVSLCLFKFFSAFFSLCFVRAPFFSLVCFHSRQSLIITSICMRFEQSPNMPFISDNSYRRNTRMKRIKRRKNNNERKKWRRRSSMETRVKRKRDAENGCFVADGTNEIEIIANEWWKWKCARHEHIITFISIEEQHFSFRKCGSALVFACMRCVLYSFIVVCRLLLWRYHYPNQYDYCVCLGFCAIITAVFPWALLSSSPWLPMLCKI